MMKEVLKNGASNPELFVHLTTNEKVDTPHPSTDTNILRCVSLSMNCLGDLEAAAGGRKT